MKVLFGEDEIRERTNAIAQEIKRDFPQGNLVILSVLKGAFVFMADLIRHFDNKVEIDFIRVASYRSRTESSGNIEITKDVELEIAGRDVLVIEDILDSGLTLNFLQEWLLAKLPRSLKFCVLIDKRERRKAPFSADYVGFSIKGGFLVGYGLDCNEEYRNLPGIFTLDDEVKQQ